MGWMGGSNYVLDYFFFLPTFNPAASKSERSSSFFFFTCVESNFGRPTPSTQRTSVAT